MMKWWLFLWFLFAVSCSKRGPHFSWDNCLPSLSFMLIVKRNSKRRWSPTQMAVPVYKQMITWMTNHHPKQHSQRWRAKDKRLLSYGNAVESVTQQKYGKLWGGRVFSSQLGGPERKKLHWILSEQRKVCMCIYLCITEQTSGPKRANTEKDSRTP